MLTELVLNGLVAALLAVTVSYCFVLNRRLGALRSGQDGLLEVVRTLNVATEQARAGVRELHETGQTVGEKLSDQVVVARAMTDELSLIVESGNNLADRLATEVSDRRPAASGYSPDSDRPASQGAAQPALDNEPALSRLLQAADEQSEQPDGIGSQLRQALKAVR